GFIASLLAILVIRPNPNFYENYAGLLALLCTILACRYLRSLRMPLDADPAALGRPDSRKHRGELSASPWLLAGVAGLAWGLLLLPEASFGLVWVGWLALAGWYSRRTLRSASWLPALIVPILLIFPWALRNNRVLHSPVLIRSNLGLELSVSNNPCA